MTPEQFRAALDSLGLDKAEVAKLLRIDERSVRRYAQHGVPEGPTATLLRLLWTRRVSKSAVRRAR